MQWQSDCGLLAIGTATALCEGQDPVLDLYDQQRMRPHLLQVMEMKACTASHPDEPDRCCTIKGNTCKFTVNVGYHMMVEGWFNAIPHKLHSYFKEDFE